jgi:murein DD-endopeptidase MepM/ murein hydrolase activator NlpD
VVFVRHDTPWGTFTSMYAHVNWMSSGVPVLGQTVSKGQQIAVIGNGGGVYPYHLHFELRAANNTIVGPAYISSQSGTPPRGQIDPNAFISTHR